MKSLYETIGVSPTATQDEITAKCVELGKQFLSASERGDLQAAMRLKEVEAVFETLGDVEKRKQFDLSQGQPTAILSEPSSSRNDVYAKLKLNRKGLTWTTIVTLILLPALFYGYRHIANERVQLNVAAADAIFSSILFSPNPSVKENESFSRINDSEYEGVRKIFAESFSRVCQNHFQ